MRLKLILWMAFLMLSTNIFAQEDFNLDLIAHMEFDEDSNDIWGYVDSNGTEYAIVGTATNTRIISLADPANPVEVHKVTGARSIWRDMKVWNDHIYVTTDQGNDGLTIIDMSEAQDSITSTLWQPEITADGVGSILNTCHNLYIDENGVCYLAGCDVGRGGIIILDIITNPNEPAVIGIENITYAHDVYVRDDIMYCSEINDGQLSVYDVSDKANPELLGSVQTSFNFCHNAWLSDDGQFVYTTDERGNAFVDAYDVTDFSDMKRVDMFQPAETAGEGVVPHNTHVLGNFLVTSWYTDGIVITDATHPDNLIKVGAFDTFDGPHGGTNGCWGAYPYLPSGLVLASDISTGFYVFSPTYAQAAYLEGTVTDANTGNGINGVSVSILANELIASETNPIGEYKSGTAQAGIYMVEFSHPDYESTTLEVELINGEIAILDAQLSKLPTFLITGNVFDVTDNSAVANAKLAFYSTTRRYDFESDASGNFALEVFEETYDIVAGAWGYKHKVASDIDATNPGDLSFGIEPGYMDDFVLDLGWNVVDDGAETGIWTREVPIGTRLQGQTSNIDFDMPDDIGDMCYMTGNGGGGAGDDDVDGGGTSVISDAIDVSHMNDPVIKFNAYFFNDGGFGDPNDLMSCLIYDNVTGGLHVPETIDFNTGGWSPELSIFLKDYISDFSDFNVAFFSRDSEPGHIVEAAVDKFRIVESDVNDVNDLNLSIEVQTTPNPFKNETNLTWEDDLSLIEIYDVTGQKVQAFNVLGMNTLTVGNELQNGIYIAKLIQANKQFTSIKLIKQ